MTTEELAWLAGLYEGEGSRELHHRGNGMWGICLTISMTDEDVVRSIQRITKVGGVDDYPPYGGKPGKRIYRWKVTRREQVLALAEGMYPFLGARRRQQLDPLIAHCRERLQKRAITKIGAIEMNVPTLCDISHTSNP